MERIDNNHSIPHLFIAVFSQTILSGKHDAQKKARHPFLIPPISSYHVMLL